MDKIIEVLEDCKILDLRHLDVKGKSSEFDHMIVVSATSVTHAKATAEILIDKLRPTEYRSIGVEGTEESQWILVDCGSVLVHIFLKEVRAAYNLEDLWQYEMQHHNSSK